MFLEDKNNKIRSHEMANSILHLTLHVENQALLPIQCYSVRRKKGNVLLNDALNTFYLRLYDVRHMLKAHSDS